MNITMIDTGLNDFNTLGKFLTGIPPVKFSGGSKKQEYEWVKEVLNRFGFRSLRKGERGKVREYIQKITGYSDAQLSRLIAKYLKGKLYFVEYQRHSFPTRYSPADIVLLVKTGNEGKYIKGVYHINSVDEITQWEIIASVEQISEAYLEPILKLILEQYPFVIIEFHADNGSEYINHTVAKLLNKLLIKHTKSRARQTNDNALVESKNGSIIRKHMGYFYINQKYAPDINDFYLKVFNLYLNFHRPCGFATITTNPKGKQKKIYKTYLTPYEALKNIPNARKYLKPGVTFNMLDQISMQKSDNEYASIMEEEKTKLFDKIGLKPIDF